MSTVAMSGNDTIIINNRVLADFADANLAELTFPTDISSVKTGKNGNSIYGFNATGKQADVKLRIVRGSPDDRFLNGLQANQQNNFAGMVLLNGQFIKKIGDGQGNVTSDTYILSGGVFSKQVEAKSNAEGDSEQSVAIYSLRFSNAPRAIT